MLYFKFSITIVNNRKKYFLSVIKRYPLVVEDRQYRIS